MRMLVFFFSVFIFSSCNNRDQRDKVLITENSLEIKDSLFLNMLDHYIDLSNKTYEGRFVQVFTNYERNMSRYVFYKTKSYYDLISEEPHWVFERRGTLVLLYTGLEFLTKKKRLFSDEINKFISKSELIMDVGPDGNYMPGQIGEKVKMGGTTWELKVYHSFNDSVVLNENYQGFFRWDGSRIRQSDSAEIVRPIVKEDVKVN